MGLGRCVGELAAVAADASGKRRAVVSAVNLAAKRSNPLAIAKVEKPNPPDTIPFAAEHSGACWKIWMVRRVDRKPAVLLHNRDRHCTVRPLHADKACLVGMTRQSSVRRPDPSDRLLAGLSVRCQTTAATNADQCRSHQTGRSLKNHAPRRIFLSPTTFVGVSLPGGGRGRAACYRR